MTDSEHPEIVMIPAEEVREDDKATLTVEERDGVPVLIATGGTAVPSGLTVLDEAGNPVAAYVVAPLPDATASPQVVLPQSVGRAYYSYTEEVPSSAINDGTDSNDVFYIPR